MAENSLFVYDLGGTFRTRAPEETIKVVRPLLKQFGVTRVANVTGLDTVGVPVWCAVRPLARSLTVSQGKGITHELAAISAAMESIELHHGEHCVPEGVYCSLAVAMSSNDFIDPTLLPVRSDADFSLKIQVPWVLARSEISGRSLYIPRELLDRDSRISSSKPRLFYSSSNGLASGNCRTEAVIHGLSEVIERDQLAFWQVRKELIPDPPNTRLALDSVSDRHCRELLRKVDNAGLEISVWYATTNIRVPTFTCSIWDARSSTPYPQRSGGHGCHPYKRIALSRAITEALQSRLTHIAGGRDDMYWEKYMSVLPTYLEHNRTYVSVLRSELPSIDFEAIPEAPSMQGIDELLAWLVGKVRDDAQTDCVVMELSEPTLPFNVVQVVAPGLDISAKRNFYSPGPRMMRFLENQELTV